MRGDESCEQMKAMAEKAAMEMRAAAEKEKVLTKKLAAENAAIEGRRAVAEKVAVLELKRFLKTQVTTNSH